MKKTLLTLTAIMVAVGAFAQGTVVFNNRVTGTIVSQIRAPDLGSAGFAQRYGNTSTDTPAGSTVYTGALLAGAGWTATLWAAPGSGQLEGTLVQGASTTFRTGSAAGFLAGITATLANIASDAPVATLQIRVFPTSYGTWANALAAFNTGTDVNAIIGKSVLFDVTQIGGNVNTPANLIGLTSFSLMNPTPVPEPASMALAGLGAASLLIFRRRK